MKKVLKKPKKWLVLCFGFCVWGVRVGVGKKNVKIDVAIKGCMGVISFCE